MKIYLPIILIIMFSCSSPDKESTPPQKITDNKELSKMHEADQADRKGIIDWSVVSVRDSARLARVNQMVEEELIKTGRDHYHAAMIYQHGGDTTSSGMAVKMMRKAIEMDPSVNKWLLAAAIDRDLMYKNEPQIFGTQFRKDGEYEPWVRYTIDSTKVTDKERIEYGVESLEEQRLKVIRMNKKNLSELVAEGKSVKEIISLIRSEGSTSKTYDFSENGINNFGYEIMNDQGPEKALPVFELNTELYPDAWNTFDSLGECLLALNQNKEAVKAYQKSLDLNPNNTTAKEVIAKYNPEARS
ncbi:MAG: tetratricopeptide repeat protein [Cyclobacteriaceae bacterium]